MATEIRVFTVTVPAQTPITAPITVATAFPPRVVEALQIVVPPGPSGQVGFAVLNSGVTVIPYHSDDWIVTAGENITWPLERQVDSGAWAIRAYNTGLQDHSVYFRFLLSPTGLTKGGLPTTIDEDTLNAASSVDLSGAPTGV